MTFGKRVAIYLTDEVNGAIMKDEFAEENVSITPLLKATQEFGEWKELIGYLKAKKLTPQDVMSIIEKVSEC